MAAAVLALASGTVATSAPPPRAPAGLKLVNYYPATGGWSYMWQRWDPRTIDADFARIAGLHANAVRVIVQTDTFGYPRPSATYRARLARVVRLAAAHRLRVELTLFDWWRRYDDVAGSERWATALLRPYAGDPRLAAVELQNELDPADPAAVRWARVLLPFVRDAAGGVPVTLSVAGHDPAARIVALAGELGDAQPDFWTVHYYDPPELAYAQLAGAQAAAAPRPLFVGETGYWPGDSTPRPETEADAEDEQVRYLRTVGDVAAALGLPPIAPWTLRDFAPGASPVELGAAEYHFGLFRVDGSAKPAAAEIRSQFGGRPQSGFDAGFEQKEAGVAPAEPALWRRLGDAAFARDARVEHGGRASASIAGSPAAPTLQAAFTTATPTPWVAPGQTSDLRVWARGESVTGTVVASLRWYDGYGHRIASADSAPLPLGTTGWTLLEAKGTAPPGAIYVRIALRSDGDTGRAWFDDVTLATPPAGAR